MGRKMLRNYYRIVERGSTSNRKNLSTDFWSSELRIVSICESHANIEDGFIQEIWKLDDIYNKWIKDWTRLQTNESIAHWCTFSSFLNEQLHMPVMDCHAVQQKLSQKKKKAIFIENNFSSTFRNKQTLCWHLLCY